jgi:hypothetical protein
MGKNKPSGLRSEYVANCLSKAISVSILTRSLNEVFRPPQQSERKRLLELVGKWRCAANLCIRRGGAKMSGTGATAAAILHECADELEATLTTKSVIAINR